MAEKEKKRFEVKLVPKENHFFEKEIFIGGELFDWSIDEESYDWARRQGPEYFRAAQEDIVKHFVESLSEFLGRKVTIEEVNEATRTGWI